jgi:DNA methylase
MRNRLHALCPYFAMFPESFAEGHIERWSQPGQLVLDPFSGRGTTALQALLMDRHAAAIDVNPVAFCISAAKCNPPSPGLAYRRIKEYAAQFEASDRQALRNERLGMPNFFGRAFHHDTLDEILFLRANLDWRRDSVDRFIAAVGLGILHGEMGRSHRYLSNQMPRTISTKPAYSLRYWRQKGLWAKKKDTFSLLLSECLYRLQGPLPRRPGLIAMGDARNADDLLQGLRRKAALVITSPPYFDVTRFEEDQWLRLWFLGHDPRPTYSSISPDDRHSDRDRYWRFLSECWKGVAPLLASSAVVVVRLGSARMADEEMTRGLTSSLSVANRTVSILEGPKPSAMKRRQTSAFRPGATGLGHEVDYVFRI